MESYKFKPEKKKHPRASANFLSALTFTWTLPLFRVGYSRDLTIEDLPAPLKEHTSSTLGDKLEKAWDREVSKARSRKKEPSLVSVIIEVFGCKVLLYGTVIFFYEIVLRISQPLLLGGLIRYFSQPADSQEITLNMAYMYAGGVIACSGLVVFIAHPYIMALLHLGMKLRVATSSLIYRKALNLSKTAANQTTSGQVVNLLSNDVNRFDVAFIFIHNLWVGPVQTAIITYLLWDLMGPAALIGLAALLIFIPYHAWLGKRASVLRLKTALRTDERVRLMNEIISGIQVIKMYTWEKPFTRLVEDARRKELREIKRNLHIKAILLSFLTFHTRTAIFFTVLSYVLFGNYISAVKVFVLTSFYNTIKETMTEFFPLAITFTVESLISVRRIRDFLLINEPSFSDPDYNKNKKGHSESNGLKPMKDQPYSQVIGKVDNPGIFIKNASAKWLESSNENTLSNITLDVTPGVLTAVVGPVGSGKTSLFHAILRELPITSGSIQVNGEISYACQEPWLFHGSVRQNILFGLDYNRERYRQIVKVCSLKTDFEQLPYGDKTIVGERGVSLSGGQRARINLARAIYKNADVYLLDDPLSAVDTHVGKHLFEDCIQGYLRDKTVILITHQLQYLDGADQILLLENGAVSALGDYETLKRSGLDFTKLMSKEEHEVPKVPPPPPQKSESSIFMKQTVQTFGSIKSIQSIASSCYDESNRDMPTEVAETQSSGTVSGKVYKAYLVSGGGCCMAFIVLFMFVLAQVFATGGDYWITYWVNLEEYFYERPDNATLPNAPSSSYIYEAPRDVCIYVFGALTGLTIIVTLTRSYMFFNMCVKSSMRLHNNMFISISRATMWFFNNNTSGRILNRFSKDIGIIDELLPNALMDVLQIGINLVTIIIVVASINPFLLVPTFVISVIFFLMSRFYIATSRSVKRLEGITKSPVFSHVNASIQGLTTIRAFKAEKVLIHEFDNHQDLHSSAYYLYIASSRTLGYWLDIMCLIYIASVTLSFLVFGGDDFGGNVGLAITQAIGLSGNLQWGIRQTAEVENQMTSVERVLEYSSLESEPPLESQPDKKPKETWPEHGKIEFSKVYLRYSANEPWVLKNLNFTILPLQKVGIVGRTGAGKSSIISALFRLTEVNGAVVIDNINTSTIGLHDLRSKISIIPQEPVLFSGTLRKNLDPFDDHNDDVLWSALEEVELKDVVKEMAGGLQVQISEGGSNLSVGQRQLVCLARAIVRNNKILVLDEATANVDIQTDIFIQQTIRKKFAACTVITVAHRLNTVMDSDKILVMDAGTVVEFDHPHILLQNKNGFLYSMVQQSGRSNEEKLRRIAAENYDQKQFDEDMQRNDS